MRIRILVRRVDAGPAAYDQLSGGADRGFTLRLDGVAEPCRFRTPEEALIAWARYRGAPSPISHDAALTHLTLIDADAAVAYRVYHSPLERETMSSNKTTVSETDPTVPLPVLCTIHWTTSPSGDVPMLVRFSAADTDVPNSVRRATYALPEGFWVGRDPAGAPRLNGPDGRACTLMTGRGRDALTIVSGSVRPHGVTIYPYGPVERRHPTTGRWPETPTEILYLHVPVNVMHPREGTLTILREGQTYVFGPNPRRRLVGEEGQIAIFTPVADPEGVGELGELLGYLTRTEYERLRGREHVLSAMAPCECAEALGEAGCGRTEPPSFMHTVEWIPRLAWDPEGAGIEGDYPGNGAQRSRVRRECAAVIFGHYGLRARIGK